MKKGKVVLVPVNPEEIREGQFILIEDKLLGTRIGKIKSIHKDLGKIIFEETGNNFTATKGVLIDETKTIVVEYKASSNRKYQTTLKYSDWKNVIDNKLIDKDVHFKFEIIYPEWNDYQSIDLAFIVNHNDDVYVGRLGDAIDFVQEYPEAIHDLIKASGIKFTETL